LRWLRRATAVAAVARKNDKAQSAASLHNATRTPILPQIAIIVSAFEEEINGTVTSHQVVLISYKN